MELTVFIPIFFTVQEIGAKVTELYKGTVHTTVGSFAVLVVLLIGSGIQRFSLAL